MNARPGAPERHHMFTMDGRKLLVFVFCSPPADFFAVLIDKPNRLGRDIFYRAADQNWLRLRMFGPIKTPDSGVSKAAEIIDMRLRWPKRKPFEDFGRARTAPWPNILDKTASRSSLHGFLPRCEIGIRSPWAGVKGWPREISVADLPGRRCTGTARSLRQQHAWGRFQNHRFTAAVPARRLIRGPAAATGTALMAAEELTCQFEGLV